MRNLTIYTQEGEQVMVKPTPEQIDMLHTTRARRDRTIKMTFDSVRYILDPRSFSSQFSRIYEASTTDTNSPSPRTIEELNQRGDELGADYSGIS